MRTPAQFHYGLQVALVVAAVLAVYPLIALVRGAYTLVMVRHRGLDPTDANRVVGFASASLVGCAGLALIATDPPITHVIPERGRYAPTRTTPPPNP